MSQLTDMPSIVLETGSLAREATFEATFADLSVRCVRNHEGCAYAARGIDKKEPGNFNFWYSPYTFASLCHNLVDLYNRPDALNSTRWVIKEILP